MEAIGEELLESGESLFPEAEEVGTTEVTAEAGETVFAGLSKQQLITIGIFSGSILIFLPQIKEVLKRIGLTDDDIQNISTNMQQVSQSISSNGKIEGNLSATQLKLYSKTLSDLQELSAKGKISSSPELNDFLNKNQAELGQSIQIANQAGSITGSGEFGRTGGFETLGQNLSAAFLGTSVLNILILQIVIFIIAALILWYFDIPLIYNVVASYLISSFTTFIGLQFKFIPS